MKMIAIGTVHGRKLIAPRDKSDPKSKDKHEDIIAKPGDEFDTKDFGIGEDEAKDLVARKVAKRKVREVPDDGESHPRGHRRPRHEDLAGKSDDELRALAAERNITIAPDATRDQIVEALQAPKA